MQQAANGSSPHIGNQQLMAGQSPSASGTAAAGTPTSSQGGTTAPEPALVTKVSQAIALLRSANPAAGDAFLNRVKTIPQSQILQVSCREVLMRRKALMDYSPAGLDRGASSEWAWVCSSGAYARTGSSSSECRSGPN